MALLIGILRALGSEMQRRHGRYGEKMKFKVVVEEDIEDGGYVQLLKGVGHREIR